ncbi:hypothetical protein [Burkholderia cepacia]|uniref:hypothetical protein n=1 Tax=Burkholderia cepacia TaxID=292 RepID=UPI000AA29169|nr:hypothetical protein [Burkholderia cepacia]
MIEAGTVPGVCASCIGWDATRVAVSASAAGAGIFLNDSSRIRLPVSEKPAFLETSLRLIGAGRRGKNNATVDSDTLSISQG